MPGPTLPDLEALSLDDLKKLVVQLLVRVVALEEENARLREEKARLKALPKRPKLAHGPGQRAGQADQDQSGSPAAAPEEPGPVDAASH